MYQMKNNYALAGNKMRVGLILDDYGRGPWITKWDSLGQRFHTGLKPLSNNEIFARKPRKNWDIWGDEVNSTINFKTGSQEKPE